MEVMCFYFCPQYISTSPWGLFLKECDVEFGEVAKILPSERTGCL